MPEIKLDIRSATLIVAASDSLHRNMADYVCDQVADEVEINQALNALPAQGGRVVLLEGQYVLATPVIIPGNDIVLEGQGWATFINGNNLLTGNHAIQISAWSNCHIKNLSVRTQAGGGKVSHCIFGEDGCNDLRIENIYFWDSDSDAIHIEGTSTNRIKIFKCFIEGADDYGIYIGMDAGDHSDNFHIKDNHIYSTGINGIHIAVCTQNYHHIIEGNSVRSCVGHGICLVEDVRECSILGNYILSNGGDGIRLETDCDNNLIENNFCDSNTGRGIVIAAATCGENKLKNNKLIGNTAGAITDSGVYTQLPFIFVPVPEPGTVIGTHPATLLTDGLAVTDRIEVYIPHEFQELVRAHIVLVPGGTGNLRMSVATNWGEVGSGEVYNSDVGAIAAGEVAVNINHVVEIDISAAFTGVAPVAPDDAVGIEFTRHGNHANDDVDADCYLLGVRIEYV